MSLHHLLLPVAALAALAFTPAATAQWGGLHFECASREQRTVHCPVDTRGGVALVRQHSRAPCIEGQSWGWDRRGVWVSRGCRGEFATAAGMDGHAWQGRPGWGPGPGWQGRPDWDDAPDWDEDGWERGAGPVLQGVCESWGQRTAWCSFDTRHGVVLLRQLSRGACIEGHNWGWDRRGVWVSQGCRAEFASAGKPRRPHGPPPHWQGPGGGWGGQQMIRCESTRSRSQNCTIGHARSVRLQRQLSRVECREGYNWGWDRGGLWVSHGCRAEFVVW